MKPLGKSKNVYLPAGIFWTVNNKYGTFSTFLDLVTEKEDLIATLHAATIFVDTADTQLCCVWGTCRTAKRLKVMILFRT